MIGILNTSKRKIQDLINNFIEYNLYIIFMAQI